MFRVIELDEKLSHLMQDAVTEIQLLIRVAQYSEEAGYSETLGASQKCQRIHR